MNFYKTSHHIVLGIAHISFIISIYTFDTETDRDIFKKTHLLLSQHKFITAYICFKNINHLILMDCGLKFISSFFFVSNQLLLKASDESLTV